MGDVVSLNKAKKQAARKAARAGADANAVKFGQTKAERTLEKARAEKAARELDAHRRDTD
jgi:phage protein D